MGFNVNFKGEKAMQEMVNQARGFLQIEACMRAIDALEVSLEQVRKDVQHDRLDVEAFVLQYMGMKNQLQDLFVSVLESYTNQSSSKLGSRF